MTDTIMMLKDAPTIVQVVAAYMIIKGSHVGWDKYRARNGGSSTGTRRAVEEMEQRVVPLIQANQQILVNNRETFQEMEGHLDSADGTLKSMERILQELQRLQAEQNGSLQRVLGRLEGSMNKG